MREREYVPFGGFLLDCAGLVYFEDVDVSFVERVVYLSKLEVNN